MKAQRTDVQIDKSNAGQVKVQFGIGVTTLIGSITLPTSIENILFQAWLSNTPFLICSKDTESLGATFDNLRSILIRGKNELFFVHKFGHPFLLFKNIIPNNINCNNFYLTELELRQLHKKFIYSSTARLIRVLKWASQSVVNFDTIKYRHEFSYFYQLHIRSSSCFKFALQDNHIYLIILFLLMLLLKKATYSSS